MQSCDGRINVLLKDMLPSNFDSSAYSIFTDSGLLLKSAKKISEMNWCHTSLVLCEADKVSDIPKISNKLKFLTNVTLAYEKPLNRQVGFLSQIGFIYNNNHVVDWKETSWFRPDVGRCTNLWDLTPNSSFIHNKYPVEDKEPSVIKYGEISYDVLLLLHNISTPIGSDRFIYQGTPSDSVLLFAKNVLKSTIFVDNQFEQARIIKKYEELLNRR